MIRMDPITNRETTRRYRSIGFSHGPATALRSQSSVGKLSLVFLYVDMRCYRSLLWTLLDVH